MGKTEDGAIWLSENKLEVNNFWQYWRNTSDDDVIKFLYLFTEIENKEIEKFKSLKGEELNDIKILLANEVTKLCHSEEKATSAESEAKLSFIKELNINTLKNFKQNYLETNQINGSSLNKY